MKRMLFYTYWNFDDASTSGICAKILSQRKVFEEQGYEVDFTFLSHEDFYIEVNGDKKILQKKSRIWTKPLAERQLAKIAKLRRYDFVYMRYNCTESGFMCLIKTLKKLGSKIILEIPTFPYDGTYGKNMRDQIYLWIDKLYRGRMHKYIDCIVTYGNWEKILKVPTIRTFNGIDVKNIPMKKCFMASEDIHLICVAIYAQWHGLERMLRGLRNYYKGGISRKVYLHVVGDGPALGNYKKMVKECGIEEYVYFYGLQKGAELDQIYEKCDIGIEVLGGHRIGIEVSSSMKSREYLVRGLPFISELDVDIIPKDWKYFLPIPYDESDIDICQIVKFYEKHMDTEEKRECAAKEIRDFAIDKIDMKETLKEIVAFYEKMID